MLGTCTEWLAAMGLCVLSAGGCGEKSLNELPDLYVYCYQSGSTCECDANRLSETEERCSPAAVGAGARCCADTAWPQSGTCKCEPEPAPITPPTIGCGYDGGVCECNSQVLATEPSCFPGGGVCCLYPSIHDCACYTTLSSCEGAQQVSVCDPPVVSATYTQPEWFCGGVEVQSCVD